MTLLEKAKHVPVFCQEVRIILTLTSGKNRDTKLYNLLRLTYIFELNLKRVTADAPHYVNRH